MTGSRTLQIAEMFGPTFQGEGPSCGQRAVFVRLAGCPLACVWCDTPYTWDWSRFDRAVESRTVTVDDVVTWVNGLSTDLVVVTGGEPLAQRRSLTTLCTMLAASDRRVEIETSGVIPPPQALTAVVARFVVSPKLAHSGMPRFRRIRPDALHAFAQTGKGAFKFVVRTEDDLDEVAELAGAHSLTPVWIMPEGATDGQVLAGIRRLADPVLARGWHLTSRLHILTWGDRRGR
ncbi:7-carboxy-7-deazaguanine synthase QueE [Frankia sp. CiP3]|uniref:7-carboxy-7-deazaguanine synthase QueE n=1 Tax=Frankia sp. CiP3 TaxID=2880971 RepID=UPI001EF6E55B|nr:7-carboxy-7-deazaguanine synthase QueE [Frankia sp. CiP3]